MTFTTKQLARIAGITKWQLMAWDRQGLLRAARGRVRGKTADRAYTRAQALGVIALAMLRRSGVSERKIRAAAAMLPVSIEGGAFLVFDGVLLPQVTAEEAIGLMEERPGSRVMRVAKLIERLPA